MIAALFVATDGVYFNRPDVEPYDVARDARTYDGPWPVVAHPPCNQWVNFAALNWKRYGRKRPGDDDGCFASALASLKRCCGVLEHPAGSRAFAAFGIAEPRGTGWQFTTDGLWVCEVWQSAYGHRARKRTWLIYCGAEAPPELNWSRQPGTHQIGWFDRAKPTLGKKQALATPPAFADVLISIARNARADRSAA